MNDSIPNVTVKKYHIKFDDISLNFVLPPSVVDAFNNMRADEIAGLLPVVFKHVIYGCVPQETIDVMTANLELMELSDSRVKIVCGHV